MRDRLRIALIGLGDIGLNAHLPALLRHRDVELVCAVDPDPARREAADARLPAGVRATGAYDKRSISEWDAAILATPPWVTPQLVDDLLGHGLYVLAEKPLALELPDAIGLVRKHEEARTHLQLGVTYRHHPNMQVLQRLLADRGLGERVVIRIQVHDEIRDDKDAEHRGRVFAALAHGSPLLHEGPHMFDWLTYLTGESWTLRALSAYASGDDVPGDNLCLVHLSGSNGTAAHLEVSWYSYDPPPSVLCVTGGGGHATLDLRSFELSIRATSGVRHFPSPGDRTAVSFDRQLDSFTGHIRAGLPPDPGIDVALSALRLSDDARFFVKMDRG